MHLSLLSWRENFLKTLKDQSCNAQNRSFSEMDNPLFNAYKNSVIPHDKNMFQIASDMAVVFFVNIHNFAYHTPF